MKKNKRRSKRPVNPNNSLIDELGLNPDYYDANGDPIDWIDEESGALMGGDPAAFAAVDSDAVQVIGNPLKAMFGGKPVYRELTLDDIEDDCPVCRQNRDRILAGDAPMVYVYE